MNKKIINLFLIVLLVLDIPFILYLFNFNYFAFNEDFHKKEFKKYDVYNKLNNYDIEKINNDVLDYLKNKNTELIDNGFFNEREKIHLKDVKDLIQFILVLFYFSIILFFILLLTVIILNKKNLKRIIKNLGIVFLFSGILTFLDAFIFWIMVKINFNFVFDSIHKIFFKVGTYVFDPSFENIVNLYPQQFFYDIIVKIVLNTLFLSLIILIIGLFILSHHKKTKKYLNKPK